MARLPTVNGDGDTWGDVLNDFLSVAHNADGTLTSVVSVTDFGVLPSNAATTNDTNMAAAVAALPSNGPGLLVFPVIGTAVYTFTQPIIVDKDYTTLLSWGATLAVDASADPAYLLIVGNTRSVQECHLQGLIFLGRTSPSSTGAGIHFRSNAGTIRKTRAKFFGGDGIKLEAFSGTIFDVYLEDVLLYQNGMNSTSHGDGLVIGTSVSDCEYTRVIANGDVGLTSARYGINVLGGGQHKFTQCHAYYCSDSGLYASNSTGLQVFGGEWETNGNAGLFFQNGGLLNNVTVSGAACFGNVNHDIAVDSVPYFSLTGCQCSSTGGKNIGVYNASDGVIADNTAKGGTIAAIDIESGSRYHVHDNITNSATKAIQIGATHCDVHDNLLEAGNLAEVTGANTNSLHDNTLYAGGGQTITVVGVATTVRNNPGYNPQGVAAITVTASPFTYTAGAAPETVYISGGTVSLIVKNALALFGATNQSVALEPHESVVVTYSSAPTMNKDRH